MPVALSMAAVSVLIVLSAILHDVFGLNVGLVASIAIGVAGAGGLLRAGWRRQQRLTRVLTDELHRLRLRNRSDPLTGLSNRSAFHAALDALHRDEGGADVAVLFFDLDRFKEVNDTLGHRAGDDLLTQVARRAVEALPPGVHIARLGGDEFAAIMPWEFARTPEDYGHRITNVMARPFELGPQQVRIGASVGIAVGDPAVIGGVELLRRADIAMYAAKASDRAKCRMFDDVLDDHEVRESSVRIEVDKALISDHFEMHFQPLIDARSGMFDSAEGLLRAQSPALRDVSTAALIATVEASGQIHALTDWTVEAVLQAIVRMEDTPIALNISPVYFRQPEFVHKLLDRMLLARVRPDLLILEVTEGVLIENLDTARQSLARLRQVGVKVHLDDFGTGYSSLSYLQHFELDGLKLDKSFLQNIGDKPKANRIIRSVIDFGHSLDLRVIVEGVESGWQARLLHLLGADVLQGYEIAMPMTLGDLAGFRHRHGRMPWLPSDTEHVDRRRAMPDY